MAEFKKLSKMIQSALRQSAEESSMLLNQELTVENAEVLEVGRQGYLADLEDSAFVVGVESREDYAGRFFMVFALRDAILMSGILLGIPSARISEKRKLLILEADDIDAFSEIANQIIGSFNSVFQPCLPLKVHLKQLPPTKFVPQVDTVTDEIPIPDGEYLLYKVPIKLRGEEMNRFDILVPLPLAHLFEPQEEKTAAAESPGAAVHDQAESLRRMFPEGDGPAKGTQHDQDGFPAVLVLDDDAQEREQVKGFLAAKGFSAITAHLGADINGFFETEGIRVVVLGTAKAEEWELSLCSRLRHVSRDPGLPIIMCARQWTRTGVLKAVQNGANDIIMKPYEEGELLAKLSKCLDAA
jgi:CheY-like chemotaxis protein